MSRKICIWIFLFLLNINVGFSQVIVQFTTPPNNYRNFNDLWNLSINNVSGIPLQFNAELTLTDSKQSTLLTGRLQNLELPAGLTLFSAENFNYSNISFGGNSTATQIKQYGILPSGSYGLCVVLTNLVDGMEMGRSCVNFSVLQSASTQTSDTLSNKPQSKFMKNFQFHGFGEGCG